MARIAPNAKFASPEEVSAPGPKPPKIDGGFMFVFTHKRTSWEVRCGKIVPRLGRQPIMAGVNLIRRVGKKWDLSGFRAWADERGRQVIPWNIDAPEFGSYMQRVGPGMYIDRWSTAYSGSNHVTFDEIGYCDWLTSLVDRGIIQAPELDALEMLERSIVMAIDSAGLQAASLPPQYQGSRASNLERLQRDLEVVQAELAMLHESAAPVQADYDNPEII
jgi:hypothetical protein